MNPFFVLLLLLPLGVLADSPRWDQGTLVKADIDCDGTPDQALLGYEGNSVILKLALAGGAQQQPLSFALAGSTADALCGSVGTLSAEPTDAQALLESLGEVPKGYQQHQGCFDLVLSAGECDAVNLYWDHQGRQLAWWRL